MDAKVDPIWTTKGSQNGPNTKSSDEGALREKVMVSSLFPETTGKLMVVYLSDASKPSKCLF